MFRVKYAYHQEQWMLSYSTRFSALSFWMGGCLESRCIGRVCGVDVAVRLNAPCTRPTQWLSRPPPIQTLAKNRMLQLNIQCSWWWAYIPETCRAKNTLIKLPCCIKLAFQVISRGRCTDKQPPNNTRNF